jgi:hypothetical protein
MRRCRLAAGAHRRSALAARVGRALLLALLVAPGALRPARDGRPISFRASTFDADQVRVEAVGADTEDVRWVAILEPSTRWDAARGRIAFVEVLRDVPMRVVGTVRDRPGGRVLGRIGGRFVYDGNVRMLAAAEASAP